jgi:hypothetical protein
MPLNLRKRSAVPRNVPNKRSRVDKGSASQPIHVDASQSRIRTSPRKALAIAASQATEANPFESQLRDMISEDAIAVPTEGSGAATEAETVEIPDNNNDNNDDDEPHGFECRMAYKFDGNDWGRLKPFCKPLRTLKNKKSWVCSYGYRVALRSDMSRHFWVCKLCHTINSTRDKHIHKATHSTSGALKHLRPDRPGHRRDATGELTSVQPCKGQTSLKFAAGTGL